MYVINNCFECKDIDGKTPLIVAYQYGRLSIDYLRVGQGQISKKIFLLSSICSQKNVGNRAPKVDDEAVFKGRTSNIKGLLFWCSSTLLSKVDKLEAASMYNAPLLSYFFFTRAYLKGTLGRGCKKLFGPIFGRLRAADTKVVVS